MPKSRTNKATSSGRTRPVAHVPAGGAGKVKAAAANPTKLLTIIAMLRRPDGATIADLVDATGWKPNSVRGAISEAIKKRRLMKVITEVANGIRTYRITG
jgi:Tfp pilus assembly protein PilX